MKLALQPPGDEVEVDILGRVFSARVTGNPAGGTVPIEPTVRNVSYRRVRARQVKRVFSSPATSTQLQLGATS